ncbi:MAG: hypothetical protein KDD62_14735, partial [Bdellovibrionales bacterium]|nr:hypothetical protein [Bdellovibrionales bacterium]
KVKIFANAAGAMMENKLQSWCLNHSDVTFMIKQLGDCPFEISIEALSYEHLNETLFSLKQEFANCIDYLEILLVRRQAYNWGAVQ